MIRKNLDYINDIIDLIFNIEKFVGFMDFDNFKKDEKTMEKHIRHER